MNESAITYAATLNSLAKYQIGMSIRSVILALLAMAFVPPVLAQPQSQLGLADTLAEGYLHPAQKDTMRLMMREGQVYSMEVRSDEFDTFLELISPSGIQYSNDDYQESTNISHIDLVADDEGLWIAIVSAYEDTEEGQYVLTLRSGPTGEVSRTNGKLDASDQVTYKGIRFTSYPVDLTRGMRIDASLAPSGEGDLGLLLRNPEGVILEKAYVPEGRASISEMVFDDGSYELVVAGSENSPTLEFELQWFIFPPSVAGAAEINSSRGELTEDDAQMLTGEYFDAYTLEVTDSGPLSVEVHSEDFDSYLVIVTPTDDRLKNDDHDVNTSQTETLGRLGMYDAAISIPEVDMNTGTYTIVVTSVASAETGNYLLRWRGPMGEALQPKQPD